MPKYLKSKSLFDVLSPVILLLIVLVGSIESKNRFNVLTYQDLTNPLDSINNNDSFYIQLDSFGASYHYTQNPAVAAVNSKIDDTGFIDIQYFSSYQWGDPLYIGGNNTFNILWEVRDAYNLSMLSTNNDAILGYKRNIDSAEYGIPIINDPFFDLSVGHFVLRAQTGIDSAGLLHGSLVEGTFNFAPGPTQVNLPNKFEVLLKIGDTSGSDNDVVAQLVLEAISVSRSPNYGCLRDTLQQYYNKYSVQAYNDSLLIVGTNNGLDTIAPITQVNSANMQIAACGDSAVLSIEKYNLHNICYVNPLDSADTVCSYPVRFFRDIKRGEFANANNYHKFSLTWIRHPSHLMEYAFKLYWTGLEDLYLDSLKVNNVNGLHFYALVNDSIAAVKSRIENWYTGDNLDAKNTKGFYVWDEPTGPEMQPISKFIEMIDQLGASYPDQYLTTLGAFNNLSEDQIRSDYYKSFIQYSGLDHFVIDIYPNRCELSSSSDTTWNFNIQSAFERPVNQGIYAFVNHLAIAKKEADEMTPPVDFWVTIPTFAVLNGPDADSHYVKSHRLFTAEEYWAIANLCLSYGAKGIGYWDYVSDGGCEGSPPNYNCDSTEIWFNVAEESMLKSGLPYFDLTAYNDSLMNTSPSCSCFAYQPYRVFGLVDRDANNDAVPTPLWDSIRTINIYLDSMAYFFLNANWIQAGRFDKTLTLAGTFVDSVKSRRFSDSSAFIHVAFFEKNLEDYAYFTNRRVQRGQHGKVDTQTVDIFMSGEGPHAIWDIYANHCDTIWDSVGVVKWSHKFNPGEALLMKKVALHPTWSGNLDADWTWPPFGTARLDGDLTIPSGKKLTINSSQVKMYGFYDILASGIDEERTEIIVNGELRAISIGSARVVFEADTTIPAAWYGIRAVGTGKVFIDNVVIRNAYSGISISNEVPDTIKNSLFESCLLYGIKTENNDSILIASDSFVVSNVGYGVYIRNCDSTAKIDDCYFEDIKYPIYSYYYSKPIIEDCDFVRFQWDTTMSPAITVDQFSKPKIRSSIVSDYRKGVDLGFKCIGAEISGCYFNSDSTVPTPGQPAYPRMHIGIEATHGANCKVRNSCFDEIQHRAIYLQTAVVNAGDTLDLGNNGFQFDSTWYGPYSQYLHFPGMAYQHNILTGSVKARGNAWEVRGTGYLPPWVSANTDTSQSNTMPISCGDAPGGGSKISVETEIPLDLPLDFEVLQNYPNPFNPTTLISFNLPSRTNTVVEVFNVLGQRVVTLLNRELSAGKHQVIWNGTDASGKSVSTGTYFYRIEAGQYIATKKMLFVK